MKRSGLLGYVSAAWLALGASAANATAPQAQDAAQPAKQS